MLKMLNVKNYLEISHIFHPSYDKQYEKREREKKSLNNKIHIEKLDTLNFPITLPVFPHRLSKRQLSNVWMELHTIAPSQVGL